MSYYDILEIEKNATIFDIKKAYYKLALKYHPDKTQCEDSKYIFQSINEAYSVLSDPIKKSEYDNLIRQVDIKSFDIKDIKLYIDEVVDKYFEKYNIPSFARLKIKSFIDEIKNSINDDDSFEIIYEKIFNHPKIKLFSAIFGNIIIQLTNFMKNKQKIIDNNENKQKIIDNKHKIKDKNELTYEIDLKKYEELEEIFIDIPIHKNETIIKVKFKDDIDKNIDLEVDFDTEYKIKIKDKIFIISFTSSFTSSLTSSFTSSFTSSLC
jgi:curved DNA-binding protein CbpA